MADEKTQTELNDRLERGAAEPVEQQTQQNQGGAKAPSERRMAPGRTPLFRR